MLAIYCLFSDCFLAKCEAASALLHKPRPITIGVGFDEQIIDSVPMTETDRCAYYV